MATRARIRVLNVLCALGIAVLFTGCFRARPIRIGFSAELTGRQNDLAVSLRNGVQLAVEELNASGGINGHPIELLVEDDMGTPEGARAADRALLEQDVILIIGHLTSAQTVEAYAVTQEAGVILFAPTASTSILSEKEDLFFRICTTNENMGKALARHIVEGRGLLHIAVIYDTDNLAYAEPFVTAIAEILEAFGGQIAGEVSFSGATSPDFAPLAQTLRDMQPDGIVIIASATNTGLIAQQMRLQGWDIPLFAPPWAFSDVLLQSGGEAVEGLEILAHYDYSDPPSVLQDFYTRYQERYARDTIFTAIYGYEAIQVLAEALQKTGGKAEGLSEALLETQDFPGLASSISLDRYGDVIRPIFLQRVHEGRFETVGALLITP